MDCEGGVQREGSAGSSPPPLAYRVAREGEGQCTKFQSRQNKKWFLDKNACWRFHFFFFAGRPGLSLLWQPSPKEARLADSSAPKISA